MNDLLNFSMHGKCLRSTHLWECLVPKVPSQPNLSVMMGGYHICTGQGLFQHLIIYIYRNVFIYEPCMPPCNSHRRFHRASWKALLRRLGIECVVTTERYQNAQKQSCFKGSRSLKGTQVYPKEFGRCVPS